MITCKECVWWEEQVFSPGISFPWQRGGGKCLEPRVVRGYDAKTPKDSILAEDDEGWGFKTGPDFGCINALPRKG